MTIEELKKLRLVRQSDKFALYLKDESNKPDRWNGYRLDKINNIIVNCNIEMTPSPHVVEIQYGDNIQKILYFYKNKEK